MLLTGSGVFDLSINFSEKRSDGMACVYVCLGEVEKSFNIKEGRIWFDTMASDV